MIISSLQGGLGNQMFQYAAAYSLSIDKGCDVELDLSWFDSQQATTYRSFELNVFGAKFEEVKHQAKRGFVEHCIFKIRQCCSKHSLKVINEPHFHYWPDINNIALGSKLVGYWQSDKYFSHNRKSILDEFTFPKITEEHNVYYADRISSTLNSVSLHVRRGDYVSDASTNAHHGCCSMGYYQRSISKLDSQLDDTHYFIFSDDPKWVQDTFKLDNMTIVVGNNDSLSYRDMQLMSMCKHHIIANSSFSWWGAWLGNQAGLTIAPKNWFLKSDIDTSDVYADSWLVI
ncbi:alpha-1,2-fucosyltransferase [Vibrio cionasavignyae]|uniref:alpha-1,2-fucosyltransferase n=1 Tax=Vibrio cionasavignyae TaxID=2910252 RepID=UPI003D09AB33